MKAIRLTLGILVVALASGFHANQLLNTSLKINIRNELGNIEEGVAVQLFGSEEDYKNETDPVTEVAYTDSKGNVKFKELGSRVYYIIAKKGDKNNFGAGVATDKLIEGKLNKVTVIIE